MGMLLENIQILTVCMKYYERTQRRTYLLRLTTLVLALPYARPPSTYTRVSTISLDQDNLVFNPFASKTQEYLRAGYSQVMSTVRA